MQNRQSKNTVLSSQSDASIVTFVANTANPGVPQPVFTATVPRGARYGVRNVTIIRGQKVRGAHFVLDLNKADGTRISGSTKVSFGVKNPSEENVRWLRTVPYNIWRDITAERQRNDDYKGTFVPQCDLGFAGEVGILNEQAKFYIGLEGPDVMDTTKSFVSFEVSEYNL